MRGADGAYAEVVGLLQSLCPAQCTLHSQRSADFLRRAAGAYLADRSDELLGGGTPRLGGGWLLVAATTPGGRAGAKWA